MVDDDAESREAIGSVLETRFEVLTAGTGEEALELLQKERVDVVTLDLTMPGIGGMATLERMRETSEIVPVIILSGAGTAADLARARRQGIADWVQKPFAAARLFEALSRAIQTRCLSEPRAASRSSR